MLLYKYMNTIKENLVKPKTKSYNVYKYTPKFVYEELQDMLARLKENPDIKSKASLFADRSYSYARFNEWKAKYEGNIRIRHSLKKVEEILESRLVEQGLAGKAIPMTIFLLKNYYGYTDQQHIKTETDITFKVNRGTKVIETTVSKPKLTETNR